MGLYSSLFSFIRMLGIHQKIGFDKILEALSLETKVQKNKEEVLKGNVFVKSSEIQKSTLEVEEALKLTTIGATFVDKDFSSIPELLNKLEVGGIVYFEPELKQFLDLLNTIDLILFAVNKNDEFIYLHKRFENYEFPRALYDRLNYYILPNGEFNIESHPELKKIHGRIASVSSSLRSKTNDVLAKLLEANKVKEGSKLTVINGRIVIPIKSEYKRDLDCVIHDESATGKTTYIEPKIVLELNNELRELEIEERRIRFYLFKELTNQIHKNLAYVEDTFEKILEFDLIIAKALLAKRMGGVPVSIANEVNLLEARNPLLILKDDIHKTVPFDLKLDSEKSILVLSGPNAGGKSILLKTIGLFHFMLKSGLLLPVNKGSRFPLFDDLFIDIGDDQSISDELSTYTSHMKNMLGILGRANSNSLVLLDEYGAGTDPESGGKIAAEILKELFNKGIYGVISTHYEEIKELGNYSPCINGAMQFDSDALKPLYTLRLGVPGRSFAFEVASNVGIPSVILNKARNRFGEERLSFDEQLKALNKREVMLHKQQVDLEAKQKELKQLSNQYQELISFYRDSKKKLMEKAKSEVSDLIFSTKKELESLKHIPKGGNSKQLAKSKENLKKLESKFNTQYKGVEYVGVEEVLVDPQVGLKAKVKGSDSVGEIVSVTNSYVELLVGGLKIRTKKSTLIKVSNNNTAKEIISSNVQNYKRGRSEIFVSELDLRGKNVQETLPLLDEYIDDALLLSINEVRLIHGKGTGVLRKLIRDNLRGNKFVKQLRDEHADRGGDGVTIVTFI